MSDLLQLSLITGVLFVSVVSPGPNFALVTSTAMSVSRRAGVLTALGFALASASWALLAIVGVNVLLAHAPWVQTAVRLAGGSYLAWLGFKMIRQARAPLPARATAVAGGSWHALRRAFLVSITNPKSIGFYGSIFAVMVPVHAAWWFDAALVLIAALVSAGWYGGLALLFSHPATRAVYARIKTAAETCMGLFLLVMGGRVLLGR